MLVSLIIPAYNEEAVLPKLFSALGQVMSQMDCDYEVIVINDGSCDRTLELLRQQANNDARYKVLSFSRNFGHQRAITAGLDFADGDAVVVMDADLQDPPDILHEMIQLYLQGYDVVSAQRISRQGDRFFKRVTAAMFYWLMRRMVDERMVPEVGDFRLFSRAAVIALRQFREQHRFMRGLVAWLGLKEAILPFHRHQRAAGETKYGLFKMLRFAWTAISSFSGLPLALSFIGGMLLTIFGVLYSMYVAYSALVLKNTVPGWASVICLQSLFSGATLLAIGLMGDYLARIYDEAKARPLYVLQEVINVTVAQRSIARALVLPPDTARSVAASVVAPIDHPNPAPGPKR